MYEQLLKADLGIADLSPYNVNAAYELGVRYGLRPQATIIVAEAQFANPFDVSHMVIRRYEHLGKNIGNQEARRYSNAKQLLELARDAMAQSNFIGAKSLFQALRQLRPNDHYVVQQLALATYKNQQPDPKTAL